MIHLPDPEKYDDPIRFFRDSHGVIGSVVDRFEKLLGIASQSGVAKALEVNDGLEDMLFFFVKVSPVHERDEELALFPLVLDKVPHLGFQSHGSPSRFIHEEHEAMQERAKALLALWKGFLAQKKLSPEDEKRFLEVGKDLIKLYRDHISMENQIIYTVANDNLLSPVERIAVMLMVREQHSERSVTPLIGFSNSPYDQAEGEGDVEAVAQDELELENDEEGSDEEEEGRSNS